MLRITPDNFINRLNAYEKFIEKSKDEKNNAYLQEKIKEISEFLIRTKNFRNLSPQKYDFIQRKTAELSSINIKSQDAFQQHIAHKMSLNDNDLSVLSQFISLLDPKVDTKLISILNEILKNKFITPNQLNFRGSNGETLLHKLAKEAGNENLLKKIVDLGANVNIKNQQGLTAVNIAILKKNNKVLEVLLKSPNFDGSLKTLNENYVEWTFKRNNLVAIDLLLKYTKIDPDKCICTLTKNKISDVYPGESFPRLTLLQAATLLNNIQLMKILINNGADPNAGNEHEFNKEDLRYVDAKEYFSYIKPPLYFALTLGNLKAVELLLEKGADPNKLLPAKEESIYYYKRNNMERYPQDLFVSYLYYLDTEKILAPSKVKEEMKKLLIEYGANLKNYENVQLHKEFGHIWGIGDDKNFSSQDKCTYRFEGGHDKPDSLTIQNSLKEFTEKNIDENNPFFDPQTIQNLNYTIENLYINGDNFEKDSEKVLEDIHKGLPVIINTGWLNHATDIIFYKDFVIKVNKGDQKGLSFAIQIFKSNAPLTTHVIDKIRVNPKTTSEYFLQEIDHDLQLDLIEELSLPMKNQSVGNCSLASKKASIYALFYLSALDHSDKKIQVNAKEYSKEIYKSFTSGLRLKSLEKMYEELKNDPSRINWIALGEARIKLEERYKEAKFIGKEKENIEASLKIFKKIDQDSDIHIKSIKNPTFLHYYSIANKLNTIKNVDFPPDSIDLSLIQSNTSLLHTAIMSNDLNSVEYILNNDYLNVNFAPGNASPLHIAIKYNRIEMVKLLLKYNANVNLKLVGKGSPLLYATTRDTNLEIINTLLQNGALIKDENILLLAIAKGDEKVARALSQYGADIFSEVTINTNYKTSSYKASVRHPRIQTLLMRQEIRNLENLEKIIPSNSSLKGIIEKTKKELISKKELSNSLWYNLKDENGLSFLHYALLSNKIDTINYLAEKLNIDINIKDNKGNTPLHYAVNQKNIEAVNFLLSKNAEPSVPNNNKITPFLLLYNDKKIDFETLSKILECFEKYGYELKEDRLFLNSKFVSQNWGIGDGMTFKYNNIDIEYENFGRISSANCFEESLNIFLAKSEDDPFYIEPTLSHFQYIEESMKNNLLELTPASKIYEDLTSNLPILITTGWKNHTTGILLYKGYVVKCNKGQSKDEYGITVYKPSKEITPEIIDKIRNNNDQNYFLKEINEDLALELIPELSVKIKAQVTNNCVVATQKAMLHAFYLLEAKDHSNVEIRKNAFEKANEEYKAFSSFSRYQSLKNYYEEIIETPYQIDWLMLANIKIKNDHKLKSVNPNSKEFKNYNKIKQLLDKFDEYSSSDLYNPNLNQTLIYNFILNEDKEEIIKLLSKGFNINQSIGNTTPLHIATKSGNQEMIQFLLDNEANVNLVNAKNNTPLHMAAMEGKESSFVTLIKANSDLSLKGAFNLTPIEMAIVYGHEELLFNLTPKNLTQINLSKCIALALHLNKHEFLDKFITKYKIDLNKLNLNGNSLLQLAVKNNKIKDIEFLLKHRANPTLGKPPPIILAAQMGNEEIINQLISKDTINTLTAKGSNALFEAVAKGNLKLAEKLISLGIDINKKDLNQMTPLMIAINKNDFNMVALLIKNGANVNDFSKDGEFLITKAIKTNNKKIIDQLLSSKNFDIRTLNSMGQSAAHLAIINKEPKTLNYLSNKLDFSHKNRYGNTLLHTAIIQNNRDALKFLLKKNKNSERNAKGLTPLELAKQLNKADIVDILKDNNIN